MKSLPYTGDGGTVTGAAQAPGSCPGTSLTLSMAPPLSGLESAAGVDNPSSPGCVTPVPFHSGLRDPVALVWCEGEGWAGRLRG